MKFNLFILGLLCHKQEQHPKTEIEKSSTDKKPYECKICNTKFTYKKRLDTHLQKIHEVNIKQETVQIDLKISGDKTDSKITDDPEANIKNLSVIVTPLEPQNSVRFDPHVLHNQKIQNLSWLFW